MTYLDVLLSALQYESSTVDYCGQVLVPQGKPLNRKKSMARMALGRRYAKPQMQMVR